MSSDTTHVHVDTVRRFYDLVMSGDLDSASALLDENIVIHEPPQLPYGGSFRASTVGARSPRTNSR